MVQPSMSTPVTAAEATTPAINEAKPALPPLSPEVLSGFAAQHAATVTDLNQRLYAYANQLRDMIPSELEQFKNSSLLMRPEMLAKLILGIADNSLSKIVSLSDSLKEPSAYGFKSKAAVAAGMQLLKQAWGGILEVDISGTGRSDPYIKIEIYLSGTDPRAERAKLLEAVRNPG